VVEVIKEEKTEDFASSGQSKFTQEIELIANSSKKPLEIQPKIESKLESESDIKQEINLSEVIKKQIF